MKYIRETVELGPRILNTVWYNSNHDKPLSTMAVARRPILEKRGVPCLIECSH